MNGLTPKEQVVSLKNLSGGAALELFDIELAKVVADIGDVNTSGKVVREIILKVRILPDEGREQAMVSIECSSKLAKRRGVATQVFFGVVDNQRVAVEAGTEQRNLFDKPTPAKLREVSMIKGGQDVGSV